jgi:hypothetical protein
MLKGSTMGKKDSCVFTAEGEMEAQQVRAFLESHDIPCRFRGEALRKTHGLTLDGLGLVEVHVPEDLVERARELLALAESGVLRLEEDEETE